MNKGSYSQILFAALFASSTFLAAFLLFEIEPIVGKITTPLYGGTASVWNICLFFFQFVVLIGYLITFTITKFPPRIQILVYLVCLSISLLWSKVPARQLWHIGDNSSPIQDLLIALIQHMAVPCVILATVSGIM